MKSRNTLPTVAAILVSSFLAACGSESSLSAPIVLTDGLNRHITLPQAAARIVSLAPSNTELLYEVGAGAQVVGRDDFSDFPPEATAMPSVGGSLEVYNLDAIAALKPDLVLAAQINTPEQVASLESRGLIVFYLNNPKDLAGLFQNMRTVGTLTGKTDQATTLIQSLVVRVEAVIAKLPAVTTHYNVYYELDATNPAMPYTARPGSYINTLLEKAGDHSVGASLGAPYAALPAQEVIAQNPGFILLGDTDYGVTVASVSARPGWSATDAVKNGRVFAFDDDTVSRPTARIVDAIENLAKLFHPDVFE